MTLPFFPDLKGGDLKVIEYPTNEQTVKVTQTLLRSAGINDEMKEVIAEQQEGVDASDMSKELPAKDTDMKLADLVTEGDLPDGADWNQLSDNALQEGIQAFFGIGQQRRNELPNGF